MSALSLACWAVAGIAVLGGVVSGTGWLIDKWLEQKNWDEDYDNE